MKNHMISVQRTNSQTGEAPEFASQHLGVELSFASGIPLVKDLSIRIYTSDAHTVGTATFLWGKSQKLHHCHFDISANTPIDTDVYRIYVYRNSQPQWWTDLSLSPTTETAVKTSLYNLDTDTPDYFFASEVGNKGWWDTYQTMDFDEAFTQTFLQRLSRYRSLQAEDESLRPSALFFAGSLYEGRKFSKAILGEILINGEDTHMGYSSLKRLSDGARPWKELLQRCLISRVVLIEVSKTDHDTLAWTQFKRLCHIVEQKCFPKATFIFFGLPETMETALKISNAFPRLSPSDHFFCSSSIMDFVCPLPDENTTDEEKEMGEDEEFKNILKEFINESHPQSERLPEIAPLFDLLEENQETAEQELEEMIGLHQVKKEFEETRWMALFYKERQSHGLGTENDQRNHMLFLGNPGTGKTTVAQLIGKIYHHMGLLSIGHTITTNRSELVGQYIGNTEQNTRDAIKRARGGVLFIDEAYTLYTEEEDAKDYGREVINTLLTVLSEPQPDLIVVLAGYEDKMENMLKCNPGLRDRFPLKFHFQNYTATELMDIAHLLCRQRQFSLSAEAELQLKRIVEQTLAHHDIYFSNGRWIHNLLEHGIIKSMAKRVMSMTLVPRDREVLSTIQPEDVLEAEKNYLKENTLRLIPKRSIGFTA